MKTTFYCCLLFVALLVSSQCKTQHYTSANLPDKQIRWGKGGGFTGAERYHILLENGQIFQPPTFAGDSLKELMPAAKPATGKKMFRFIQKNGLDTLHFQQPGNVYNYIEFQNGDQLNRISWASGDVQPPAPVMTLFNELNGLLPKSKE